MIGLERSECFRFMWRMPPTLWDSRQKRIQIEERADVKESSAGRRAVPVTSHDLNLHYILIRLPSAAALMVINT